MDEANLKSQLLRLMRGAYPKIDIEIKPWSDDPSRIAIYFVTPEFSVLYPAQRYHHLARLVPQDFFDEHLSNTVWFELAPGEKPEDLNYPDKNLIAEITPDVMNVLHAVGAIEALDDVMCPVSPLATRPPCFGDYRHSRLVFLAKELKEDDLFDVFHVLMAQGGFCDCEILFNAADSNRLKSQYWKARAENLEPYDPHKRSSR